MSERASGDILPAVNCSGLANSGVPEKPVKIVLNGLTGPLKIGKKTFDSEMPGLKALDDEQIASVLTYLRREWGHESAAVDPKQVASLEALNQERRALVKGVIPSVVAVKTSKKINVRRQSGMEIQHSKTAGEVLARIDARTRNNQAARSIAL